MTPDAPPVDRGTFVFSATKHFKEHQNRFNSMNLRLKKLQKDQELAQIRINETNRALEEAEKLKESKRQANQQRTQHVLDLINQENYMRTINQQMRMQLRNNVQMAVGGMY